MKIEITPSVIEQFNEEGKPPTCSISNKGIMFNKIAEKQLALTPDVSFNLEFEDGSLYFKDTNNGFKLFASGKYKVMSSNIPNLAKYVNKFFKKEMKMFRFEIGEFKEARRKLNLVE